jgi:hypothetical protein
MAIVDVRLHIGETVVMPGAGRAMEMVMRVDDWQRGVQDFGNWRSGMPLREHFSTPRLRAAVVEWRNGLGAHCVFPFAGAGNVLFTLCPQCSRFNHSPFAAPSK